MISMTFAAVTCDVDDHCSINTAYDLESSFTMSPRNRTRPLHFWCFVSNSAFFKWQVSTSYAECTVMPSFLALSIPFFLVSDFCYVTCRNLFKFLPLFFQCCFCCGYLHCLKQKHKFVYQIWMLQWICRLFLQCGPHDISNLFHTHSCGFHLTPYTVYLRNNPNKTFFS